MQFRNLGSRIATEILKRISPVHYKNREELAYWRDRFSQEGGDLRRGHYEEFYTTFFGLTRADYAGKRVLDIGCGPRGSLEWIAAEAECFGVDPLVEQYRALGIDRHRMKYVHAGVEAMPFPSGHFDFVASFNNLDHVDDLAQAVAEIQRVTAPGGTFLLITEVEHTPTPTEPHFLPRTIAHRFEPEFEVQSQGLCALNEAHDIYGSLRERQDYREGGDGIVFARMTRR